MREKPLNTATVLRGLRRGSKPDHQFSDSDSGRPRSAARRRFLLQSAALSTSPAFAGSPSVDDLRARRTVNGFAFHYRGDVLWSADVRWLANPASCLIGAGRGYAEASLPHASLPGTSLAYALRLRVTLINNRFVVRIDHALAEGPRTADLADWLAGRLGLALGRVTLPTDLGLAPRRVSLARDRPVYADFMPDLSLRLQSEGGFRVLDRELRGTFDECAIVPAHDAATRLITGPVARAAHLTLSAPTSAGASVRPIVPGSPFQSVTFNARQIRFELAEKLSGATASGWLASADGPVVLRTSTPGWIDEPHVTLLAQDVSFGRVQSDAPVSLLVATTTEATLHANDLVLTGRCVDCEPLMLAEHEPTKHARRCVAWTRGALRDCDDVSIQLHFPPTTAQSAVITQLLDAIPWHRKRISLAGVVVEFTRPDDGLWLRASLDGFALTRDAGGYRVVLDGTRCVEDIGNPPLLHLRLPPQSFSEQAFYRAPGDWTPVNPQPTHRWPITKPPTFALDVDHSEQIPDAPSALRVSGDSVLRFVLRDGQREAFELSLDSLTDSDRWQFRVAPRAQSTEAGWRTLADIVCKHTFDQNCEGALDNFTDIELPWRVHLSPDEHARLTTSSRRLAGDASFNPLFYLRPYATAEQQRRGTAMPPSPDLPLRAVASPDHGVLPWLHFGATAPVAGTRLPVDRVRTALDEEDRNELVWLSGRWGQRALAGSANVESRRNVYVPQPVRAQRLLLTAFGGSMRATANWDPPTLEFDGRQDGIHQVAMTVEEWDHVSTLGRSHFERVIYRGYLLPLGYPVSLIKTTRREVEYHKDRGYLAVPVQRYSLSAHATSKSFPCAVGQPLESLNGFFQPESFALKLDRDLQIDDPTTMPLADQGQDAFWVCLRNDTADPRYPFALRIGNKGAGTMPMAFVSNRVVHDPLQIEAVVRDFNHCGAKLTTERAKITFAPPTRQGDTQFTTHSAEIGAVVNKTMVNSALLEANSQPPFYPVLRSADIELDAIQRTTLQPTPQKTSVTYARLYQAIGFAASGNQPAGQPTVGGAAMNSGNPAEVFLTLTDPASIRFTGNGDRAGGVATPNMTANALSRSKGLIGGFVDLAATSLPTTSAPVQRALQRMRAPRPSIVTLSSSVNRGFDNPFDIDAKLLGIIPLRDVFKIAGLDDLPAFVESIDETIATEGTEVAQSLRDFAALVANASDRMDATLQSQKAFIGTAEGGRLGRDLQSIHANAMQLTDSHASLPTMLQASAALTQQLRNVDASLQAIAAHPESLLHLVAIEEIKAKLLDPLENAVNNAKELALNQITQACNEANQQITELVAQLQDYASQAYGAVADRFAERVLDYAASHRNEWSALQGSLTQASDVLAQLSWISQSYQDYYALGFGLPDAIQQITDSTPARDVAQALARVKADIGQIQRDPRNWKTLCLETINVALMVEDSWNREKLALPDQAKACAAPFAMLSRHLHDLVASRAADQIMDAMLLAPLNRAHQVMMKTIAALEAAPDELRKRLDDAKAKAQLNLKAARDALKNQIDVLVADLTTLKDKLTQTAWGPLVCSVLQSQVKQSLDALSAAGAATTDALHAALAICEALGNLFDLRLDGEPPATVRQLSSTGTAAAEQVRQAIIAIDARLRRIAQIAWRAIAQILNVIATAPTPSPDLRPLLGDELISATQTVIRNAGTLFGAYQSMASPTRDPDSAQLLELNAQLSPLIAEINNWLRLMQRLPAQIQARALDVLRHEVEALLASVVPAKIEADLQIKRNLDGYDNVFVPTHNNQKAQLCLRAHVETDLIARSTTSSFQGSLTNFAINLFGMVVLGVSRLSFSADGGKLHLESPQIDGVQIKAPLDFLDGLKEWMEGKTGPFVQPVGRGIQAGYRMSGADIPLGPLLVLNFSFEAAVVLPFDDRAAIFSVAVGRKENPCLVSVPPYGGGMFFEMQMAGSRLVALAASVEYGLMGSFNRGVISCVGRAVIGIYFMQNAQGALVQGYFYAGGYARIMHLVSVNLELRISLAYSTGGMVDGAGTFSVSIGVGPFSWTLSYTVRYQTSAKASDEIALDDKAQVRRINAQPALLKPSLGGSQPVMLRDPWRWQAYRAAFALSDISTHTEY